MFNVSPYISNSLSAPKAKPYTSIQDIVNDNRLSSIEKRKLLDRLADNMRKHEREGRNGMYFDYSRTQQSRLREIENAKSGLSHAY